MNSGLSRAWAEINLNSITHNINEIKKIIGKNVEIMGVVKADAYGHGVLEVTKTLLKNGISKLAVSMIDEAIQLRRCGIHVPILVLSYTDPVRVEEIVSNHITQTIYSYESAQILSKAAVRMGCKAKIHIKIDTGMTRIGFMPDENILRTIAKIHRLPGIIVEGLFTHFSSADQDNEEYSQMQFETFMEICTRLENIGISIPIKHGANSAAVIKYPKMHLDMVRPGIILYGHYPSANMDKGEILLKPAMTLKTSVILVKEVENNISISYGRVFTTKRKSKIATLPIGYADGYSRLLTGKANVLVNGEFAPIVGAICMDHCMIDVTDLKNDVKVGDKVVLFGKQGEQEIEMEELAASIGTINYEIMCVIGRRIPRVYFHNGEISNVLNYI